MGIRPNGQALPTVAYDTPSQQFGPVLSALDTAGSQAGGAIADIASTADSANTAVQMVAENQQQLMGRTDLLEGNRGFCMAYQSLNINAAWSNGGTRRLPFNLQYGPAKGAEISGDGIRLLEAGAWRLDAMVRARGTGYTGSDGALMDIIVERPDGSIFLRSRYDAWPGTGTESIYGGRPLVVDEPGFKVRVEVWSGRWRWWDGGDMFTFLSAVKYDNRSINSGQNTVPDEAEPSK